MPPQGVIASRWADRALLGTRDLAVHRPRYLDRAPAGHPPGLVQSAACPWVELPRVELPQAELPQAEPPTARRATPLVPRPARAPARPQPAPALRSEERRVGKE